MTSRRRKEDTFQVAFADLPTAPIARLDALVAVNSQFRRALAKQLQPTIRALLQENPPASDADRRTLAHRLNDVLRDVGLAIADPDSGQASTLVADPFRFMLQDKKSGTRSRNIQSLPPLKLVEHIRQESFSWQQKAKQHDKPADCRRGRD